ncbi:MAG: Leucine-rich repeat (LRR) protein [Alteromonas naphthalenivorans]|jgi:Leucine-rich repeat (LRR) protein
MKHLLFTVLIVTNQIYTASEKLLETKETEKSIEDLQAEYQTEKNLSFRKNGLSCFTNSKTINYSLMIEVCSHFVIAPSRLIKLNLSWNHLENIDEDSFRYFSGLEELDLMTNHLTQVKAGALTGLVKLKKLDLWNNELTKIDPSIFKDLTALEELNIGYNSQLTQKNIQEIREALPRVKVLA